MGNTKFTTWTVYAYKEQLYVEVSGGSAQRRLLSTWRNIQEEFNVQQHRCKDLESLKKSVSYIGFGIYWL
jgi:hypothetical protein